MNEQMKWREMIKDFLMESSQVGRGCASISRLLTLIIVIFVLGWDSCYVLFAWKWNHALLAAGTLPPGLTVLPFVPDGATMLAQAAFMTTFYAVNKSASAWIDGRANTPRADVPPNGEKK